MVVVSLVFEADYRELITYLRHKAFAGTINNNYVYGMNLKS